MALKRKKSRENEMKKRCKRKKSGKMALGLPRHPWGSGSIGLAAPSLGERQTQPQFTQLLLLFLSELGRYIEMKYY